MTDRELLEQQILRELKRLSAKRPDEWLSPMDFGGHNGSRHGKILASLADRGLIERKTYTPNLRKVNRYRAIVLAAAEIGREK